jgi:hypothetical protein
LYLGNTFLARVALVEALYESQDVTHRDLKLAQSWVHVTITHLYRHHVMPYPCL